jgi:hypothetical protein
VGQFISVLELHFLLGTIVTSCMLIAYVGFRPWAALRLRADLTPARTVEEQAVSISP